MSFIKELFYDMSPFGKWTIILATLFCICIVSTQCSGMTLIKINNYDCQQEK